MWSQRLFKSAVVSSTAPWTTLQYGKRTEFRDKGPDLTKKKQKTNFQAEIHHCAPQYLSWLSNSLHLALAKWIGMMVESDCKKTSNQGAWSTRGPCTCAPTFPWVVLYEGSIRWVSSPHVSNKKSSTMSENLCRHKAKSPSKLFKKMCMVVSKCGLLFFFLHVMYHDFADFKTRSARDFHIDSHLWL